MAIARNAPCPCGSGKKHKHCCLGRADPKTRRRTAVILVGAIIGVATLAAVVGWQSGTRNGLLSGIAGAIGIGMYLAIRSPPKSRGRGGGDRIDFGR